MEIMKYMLKTASICRAQKIGSIWESFPIARKQCVRLKRITGRQMAVSIAVRRAIQAKVKIFNNYCGM
jgi:hypothetical protein